MFSLDSKVYGIFKNKLGEKEAEIVIEYLEAKAEAKSAGIKNFKASIPLYKDLQSQ